MQRPPATGTSITSLAAELGVPAERVLRTAWELGDIPALDGRTLLRPEHADRIRSRCAAAPTAPPPAVPARAPTRTASGHVIPKPSPPTGEFALRMALTRNTTGGEADELAPVRRAIGADSLRTPAQSTVPRPRPTPRWAWLAAEFKQRYPGYTPEYANSVARQWTDTVIKSHLVTPEEVVAWWDGGYSPSRLQEVVRLLQAGIRAHMLDVHIAGGDTVRAMLRRGDPEHLIVRLLRDQGSITS